MWATLTRGIERCVLSALLGACGCTTWTSLHAGYGLAPKTDASVAGLEVRRAIGSSLHSGYGLIGARVDGSANQFDAEAHVGVMRPMRLSESFALAPSVTLELLRVSNLAGDWYGGAFGPSVGTELLWWMRTDRHTYRSGAPFGCMGGAVGVDCPSGCQVEDVARYGLGFRVAAEYDMRLGSEYPRRNDWVLWFTVGVTKTASARENECCYFEREAPLRQDCMITVSRNLL